ncbi:MAG: hypothetical protein J0L92_03560 [Deltaproteobacteria bacterium]|nr:hypothetical protein [Deltaproteobacteria bacterium]
MSFPEPKNLRLMGVRDPGTSQERVAVKVLKACDIGKYAIILAAGSDERFFPSTTCCWFPDLEADAGDFISLRTLGTRSRSVVNRTGTKTHIISWGLDAPVWGEGSFPVLIYVAAIQLPTGNRA